MLFCFVVTVLRFYRREGDKGERKKKCNSDNSFIIVIKITFKKNSFVLASRQIFFFVGGGSTAVRRRSTQREKEIFGVATTIEHTFICFASFTLVDAE